MQYEEMDHVLLVQVLLFIESKQNGNLCMRLRMHRACAAGSPYDSRMSNATPGSRLLSNSKKGVGTSVLPNSTFGAKFEKSTNSISTDYFSKDKIVRL